MKKPKKAKTNPPCSGCNACQPVANCLHCYNQNLSNGMLPDAACNQAVENCCYIPPAKKK